MPASEALPQFPGGARPAPETAARQRFIRTFAVLTLTATAVYLTWRMLATLNLDVWWVALPLLAMEIHNALGLALFTLALWDVDRTPPWRATPRVARSVAVLITTYNEGEDVLLPTIAAAVALEPAHETWVLDDGDRPDVRELAEELGARYLSRADNVDAKAGNINHALPYIDAELLAILDADHVPTAGFLLRTLGYFDDEHVAVVQTPQDFYNLESFEHEEAGGEDPFHEEAIFYRVIAPGKNRWGGAFWCGTGALIRARALHEVGGVATATVTEDIHTTMLMQRRGWTAVFHNEVLARGLAPDDASQYLLQRHRWALGAMQVLRAENPLISPGLTFGQRLSFMTTLAGWFDSWRTLGYIVLPITVIFSGASPIDAPGWLYGPFFGTIFISQFVALRLLARGRYPPVLSLVFEILRMPAVLPATFALLTGGRRIFRVTPKGRSGSVRVRAKVPRLLVVLAASSVLGLVWFVFSAGGLTPTEYRAPGAIAGAVLFNTGNLALLVIAIRRIRDARFAGERRGGVRFAVDLPGTVQGVPARLRDLSVGGTLAYLPGRTTIDTDRPAITVQLPGEEVPFETIVRRRTTLDDGSTELALQFAPGQRAKVARVALALLHNTGSMESDGAEDQQPAAA